MKKRAAFRQVCFLAMLIAIEVVLNRFVSINTPGVKIGFSFVPIVIAAILFGPVKAGIVYGIADFIGAILFPIGPYFPGFTGSAILMGMIYGVFLYRKDRIGFFKNVLPPILINYLALGLLVNTLWVRILYPTRSYWAWFVYRLPEYAVLIPISAILIPLLLKITGELKKIVNK